MTRRKEKGLIISAVVLVLAALLFCWQWNNLQAIYFYLTRDSAAITEAMDAAREAQHNILAAQTDLTVRPPDAKQSEEILDGSATAEEVKEELGISETLERAGTETSREELINSCAAELYALKVDVLAQLSGMKQAAVDEYRALPKEQRTETAKREIALSGMNACYDLEVSVDGQVREILDRYGAAIEAIGGDAAVLEELWASYESQKAGEKAYYMDKYLG